jgi:broad specificity phosphatase PhoE
MKKTLYLMRHGQTLFNKRRKIQGACDSPLTLEGINQAKLAREYFIQNSIEFDHAYSSTQERASDTLEIITDLEYVRLKGLKEWNFGTFEGESEDLNPKGDEKRGTYGDFFVQYDGESDLEVQDRINNTLLDIMKKDDHQSVLAVSHGGACFMFLKKWEDLSKRNPIRFSNCCILKFEYENDKFTFIEVIDPLIEEN